MQTAPYTKPDGTEVLIARAPRKVVTDYLDRHGYNWDAKNGWWDNGTDVALCWGSTIYGHYLYTA